MIELLYHPVVIDGELPEKIKKEYESSYGLEICILLVFLVILVIVIIYQGFTSVRDVPKVQFELARKLRI